MLGKWDINAANEDLVAAIHVAAIKGIDFMKGATWILFD